jgi:hypothetical protein
VFYFTLIASRFRFRCGNLSLRTNSDLFCFLLLLFRVLLKIKGIAWEENKEQCRPGFVGRVDIGILRLVI